MAVAVIVVMAVTAAVVVMIVAIVPPAVVVVVLVLTVMVAVVVPHFVAVLIAVEASLPAAVAAPVGTFAAAGERATIAEVGIVVMIDVAVEAYRATEPWSCANEDAAGEPLWPVVAKGRALVGRVVEIAVRADRRDSDADGDLRGGFLRKDGKTKSSKSGQNKNPEALHGILLADDC